MKKMPEFDIFVRFCETDAAGHVNNVSYFAYMEEARSRFFEYAGIHAWRKDHPYLRMPVASSFCNFYKEAFFGQKLKGFAKVAKLGTKSITVETTIKDALTGDLIAAGGAVFVCVHLEKRQTIEIPEGMRAILEEYL